MAVNCKFGSEHGRRFVAIFTNAKLSGPVSKYDSHTHSRSSDIYKFMANVGSCVQYGHATWHATKDGQIVAFVYCDRIGDNGIRDDLCRYISMDDYNWVQLECEMALI